MTSDPPRVVTNSAADRAGETFRAWAATRPLKPIREMTREERDELVRAILVIDDYRAMHAAPLARVTMGVRSMVRTVRGNDEIRPGQRFKRADRILEKLLRFPRMRLSQMEDIGGCRVVLPSTGEVYAVLARVMKNWPDVRVSDYIAAPKTDGYRGIHAVHRRAGRLIEVQLRTEGQHSWAETVEAWSPRVGFNLKDGAGPADLREYFKQAADRIARGEAGFPPDSAAEAEFATLRQRVLHYFQANP